MAKAVAGLQLRGIGPALMGGRIADIAVHPERRATWYVAVGSGGLWKTINGGTTWSPVFDEYPSYSIGAVALDPSSPEVVWLGTGENVSGRHVGWGDGIYRSRDGGRSWERMGLAGSQHIGKILIDPRDSDTVLAAAEGPLWNGGGERGVYRTEDGGASWTRTLDLGPDTGATDLEFAPGTRTRSMRRPTGGGGMCGLSSPAGRVPGSTSPPTGAAASAGSRRGFPRGIWAGSGWR